MATRIMNCVICNQELDDESNSTEVRRKGLASLIEFSKIRGDSELLAHLTTVANSENCTLKIHTNCRRDYTNKRRSKVLSQTREDTCKSKRLRSTHEQFDFDWQTKCFFCAKVLDDRHPHIPTRTASILPFKDILLQQCRKREDDWATEVETRLNGCLDLPAADAKYHKLCHNKFMLNKKRPSSSNESDSKKGRKPDADMLGYFEMLCLWLENEAEEELYTLQELCLKMSEIAHGNSTYSTKWLKQKLLDRYKDSLYFADVDGRSNVVCFKTKTSSIINDKWYTDKKSKLEDEAERIVETAAKIILSEIRAIEINMDKYPSLEDISDIEQNMSIIPPCLQKFLKVLVKSPLKQSSIGQCLLFAVRPRSIIPPIPFGLGVEMDHVSGSKWVVTELNKLGFSVSYDEVTRFKQNVVQSTNVEDVISSSHSGDSFTQWIADNVDYNIATLDGKHTFHGMGIVCTTTGQFGHERVKQTHVIPRQKRVKAKLVLQNKGVKIVPYVSSSQPGICDTILRPLEQLNVLCTPPVSLQYELVWNAGYYCRNRASLRPGWSGFMQDANSGQYPSKSDVHLLPIIDLNPSDPTCIYSTLLYIELQAEKLNIVTPCITFDQPLWIKAMDIIKIKSMNIVCRLGGFHLLMSFMGSIGKMMKGSGLEESLETVYGENAVQHMMTGKAVSRALRGHLLVEAALMNMLIVNFIPQEFTENDVESKESEDNHIDSEISHEKEQSDDEYEFSEEEYLNCQDNTQVSTNDIELVFSREKVLNEEEITTVTQLYELVKSGKATDTDITECNELVKLERNLKELRKDLTVRSQTAKLWFQYIDYVQLIKLYIQAERTGNWELHLIAVKKMINLFAATGHINYAKCARLYLQFMLDLPKEHPWLYSSFTKQGFHTVRRSDRFWAGLWTDLVIEQVMMRAIKSRGGLTQGRGFTDTVRLMWVHSAHMCGEVHNAMTTLTDHEHQTSEQHIELGASRLKRDNTDLMKVQKWFESHDPFDQNETNLKSIHSGVVASSESGINCDEIEKVGEEIQKSLDGKTLHSASVKKKDMVKTLENLKSGVIIEEETIYINPMVMFARLMLILQRESDPAPYFSYELTPFPTSLFNGNTSMRKANKALLTKALVNKIPSRHTNVLATDYVLDGGALLHRVRWLPNSTYDDVIHQYRRYVDLKFGRCHIVFDGYSRGASIKDHEHQHRMTKKSVDIQVSGDLPAFCNQTAFLSNKRNKMQFIDLLGKALEEAGHHVKYSQDDADTLIVSTAINIAMSGREVTVVADDTDVLVLLLHHWDNEIGDIFFHSEAKKDRTNTVPLYSIGDITLSIGYNLKSLILFVHAWSGCDTTSSIYGLGKTSILKKLQKSQHLRETSSLFGSEGATQAQIAEAGLKVFAACYGGNTEESLDRLRYDKYMNMIATNATKLEPQKLPPTERAAYFHSLRVHYQIRVWKTFDRCVENPEEWGWKKINSLLLPVMTDKEVAPENLLVIIRCKCKLSSRNVCGTNLCSCRKSGLNCVAACEGCRGDGCNNAAEPYFDDDIDTNEHDLSYRNIFDLFQDMC